MKMSINIKHISMHSLKAYGHESHTEYGKKTRNQNSYKIYFITLSNYLPFTRHIYILSKYKERYQWTGYTIINNQ